MILAFKLESFHRLQRSTCLTLCKFSLVYIIISDYSYLMIYWWVSCIRAIWLNCCGWLLALSASSIKCLPLLMIGCCTWRVSHPTNDSIADMLCVYLVPPDIENTVRILVIGMWYYNLMVIINLCRNNQQNSL